MNFFSEDQFHVETCCIAADFSKGMDIYDKVMKTIGDKEVGILGMTLRASSFF